MNQNGNSLVRGDADAAMATTTVTLDDRRSLQLWPRGRARGAAPAGRRRREGAAAQGEGVHRRRGDR